MRRRLALLMATVLCVTSVPQTSLIGVAAEHAPETELVESTDVAVDSELQSDENLVGGTVETETAAVQETLAPETEAAVTEATPEPVTETEPVTEGIPQENQSEAETTEAPQETEIVSEETQTTEVIPQEPQTEAPEETTEAPQETEPSVVEPETEETEIVTETETETETEEATEAEIENGIAVQSDEGDEGYEVVSLEIKCSYPIYIWERESSYSLEKNRKFTLQITYANGLESRTDVLSDYDYYEHEIVKKIYKADGKETSYTLYSHLNEMEAGDYYLEVSCGEKTARQNFRIVSLEAMKDNAEELKMNDNSLMAGYNDFYLYHFKVEQNKNITFQWDGKGTLHLFSRQPFAGRASWIAEESADATLGRRLYGNCDYYCYFSYNEDIPVELTLTEQPAITKIEKISAKDEFLAQFETVGQSYMQNVTIEVSYENYPNQRLNISSSTTKDSYGNIIQCEIFDKSGTLRSFYENLPIGEY